MQVSSLSSTWRTLRTSAACNTRTAYLDGLRGFAALMVYWGHHQLWAHDGEGAQDIFENAYGYHGRYYFACLPGVRNFFTGGHFAVSVFFVLSGYVLSAKPLLFIQRGEYRALGDNLSSSLFRRWLRLHLPVMVTTFTYMTILHLFRIRAIPEPKPTYLEEVVNWYIEFKNFSFVFRGGGDPWFTYNFHAWSIPVEFRGSVTVYVVLLAFSRCRPNARLLGYCGLIIYFLYIADGWFCALFVAGMLLCEIDLAAQIDETPAVLTRLKPWKKPIFYTLFGLSLYLGGVPSYNSDIQNLRDSPGWRYLSYLKPQAVFDYKWFYLFWAATLLVASVSRIPSLRAFFELPLNQYLGHVSFAFYLVHGPVLWVLGDRLYAAVGWTRVSHPTTCPGWVDRLPLPRIGPLGMELSFLAPHLILLPVTLWLAEVVTRGVDGPSVRLASWLYGKLLAET
ncbi:hypothetical protein BDW75DRAFT_248317 [Aspergillus navahoensis]